MPYGKVTYDEKADAFMCEYPVESAHGGFRPCGKWCQDLARHIPRHHQITTREYKKELGLDRKEPLLSRRTQKKFRKAVKKNWAIYEKGFLVKGKKNKFKKGDNKIQSYERTAQTKQRLGKQASKKDIYKRRAEKKKKIREDEAMKKFKIIDLTNST